MAQQASLAALGRPHTLIKLGGSREASWTKQQEKAFTGWFNAHLQMNKKPPIATLCSAVSEVVPLITIMEILERRRIRHFTTHHRKPRHRFDRLDALRVCIRMIKQKDRRGINLTYDVEELANGTNLKLCLAFVWRMIVIHSIDDMLTEEALSNKSNIFNTPQERLLHWCNTRLGDTQQILNFTSDFKDGQALVMLLNLALPKADRFETVDWEDMDEDELVAGVLRIAEEKLAIPQLLDVDQIMKSPDEQSIMTYVSLIRTAVEATEQERSHLNKSMAKMKNAFASLEDQLRSRVQYLENQLDSVNVDMAAQKNLIAEERQRYNQDIDAWKTKQSHLLTEIDTLKQQLNEAMSEKQMIRDEYSQTELLIRQEASETQKRVKELQLQNEHLNLKIAQLFDRQERSGNVATLGAASQQELEAELASLKKHVSEQQTYYETKVRQLEEYWEQQRTRFNEFHREFKEKLKKSNTAGRDYRDRCMRLEAENEMLKKKLQERENELLLVQHSLEEEKFRVRQLTEDLKSQEAVFRLQLHELGSFIKELKQQEAEREIYAQAMFEHELKRRATEDNYAKAQSQPQSQPQATAFNRQHSQSQAPHSSYMAQQQQQSSVLHQPYQPRQERRPQSQSQSQPPQQDVVQKPPPPQQAPPQQHERYEQLHNIHSGEMSMEELPPEALVQQSSIPPEYARKQSELYERYNPERKPLEGGSGHAPLQLPAAENEPPLPKSPNHPLPKPNPSEDLLDMPLMPGPALSKDAGQQHQQQQQQEQHLNAASPQRGMGGVKNQQQPGGSQRNICIPALAAVKEQSSSEQVGMGGLPAPSLSARSSVSHHEEYDMLGMTMHSDVDLAAEYARQQLERAADEKESQKEQLKKQDERRLSQLKDAFMPSSAFAKDMHYDPSLIAEQQRQLQQSQSRANILDMKPVAAGAKDEQRPSLIQKQMMRKQSKARADSSLVRDEMKEFDRKTESMKTKFGTDKYVTTWTYKGGDDMVHTVTLRHNVKKGKSKRVFVVDGIEKYNDKSTETAFLVRMNHAYGADLIRAAIIENSDGKTYKYDLYINDQKFDKLRAKWIKEKTALLQS